MIKITKGPSASKKYPLTPEQKAALGILYFQHSAWTRTEAISHLGEGAFRALLQENILGAQDTDMGMMYHLLARGRLSVYGNSDKGVSLQSQLDYAYTRLSLRQLEWEVMAEGKTFFKDLVPLFPTLRFIEVATPFGSALAVGKLTGGGYSTKGIARLIQVTRSSALNRGFTVVVLTPHLRRGAQLAERHSNIIRVVPVLPKHGQTSRFNPVVPPTKPPNQDPFYSGTSLDILRRKKAMPDLTLSVLALPRPERIEQAQLALDVDRALSATQLQRHFGLSPHDLSGRERLQTRAIVRPANGRSAVEVQQPIVVADRKVARLDDGDLVHRLTTAQIRLHLGLPADAERWIVESRGNLPVEEPDAIHIDADGRPHAIEADTGHYSITTVRRKLESFHDQDYGQTIWGAVSDTRIKNLTRQIAADRQPKFVNAKWWP